MSRRPRAAQFVPGAPHHVIVRGNNRRTVFSWRSDKLRFLRYLARALAAHDVAAHVLVLMTNHVHMILRAATLDALSDTVHSLCGRYATYRNRARHASGKLWEERFFCRPITTERGLAVTSMYCELNAVRAGLVADPLEHEWSTYAFHAGVAGAPARRWIGDIWTPSEWYLALGRDERERGAAYAAAMREYDPGVEPPTDVEEIAAIEALSALPYARRLERPDRTRAREEAEDDYGISE